MTPSAPTLGASSIGASSIGANSTGANSTGANSTGANGTGASTGASTGANSIGANVSRRPLVKVLVVDDSAFFRRRVTEMISADPRLTVIGTAVNGKEGVAKAAELDPDVITMDIEMPVLDGIGAVRAIMASNPKPVLMFSSLSQEGAKATLEALEAGALDYLPKNFSDISTNPEVIAKLLCTRILALGASRFPKQRLGVAPAQPVVTPVARATDSRSQLSIPRGVKAIAIGTSTGGPVALQKVLQALPAKFPLPIILIQHMPGSFTPAFAKRLDQMCAIRVREAATGDRLEPGLALLAPGGRQLVISASRSATTVEICDDNKPQIYRPSVDITFESLARALPGGVLAMVLTGMGSDGKEGARSLKRSGSHVWAQDERSSVIFGMPHSVIQEGLADRIVNLEDIGPALAASG